jgi:hypothetical protein
MLCQSCNKSKNQLYNVRSHIMNDISLKICQTCIDNKFEPRWIIILAARSYGPDSVKNYIAQKRYVGEVITGVEIV